MMIPEKKSIPARGTNKPYISRAVVTKDVSPYTIVGGVPTKPIRLRYPEETIAALLRLRWWDWPRERIARNIQAIQAGAIPALEQTED